MVLNKINKKTVIIFILLFILIITILFYSSRYNYIKQANNNMQMNDLKLLMNEKDIQDKLNEEFHVLGGFGGEFYESKDGKMSIIFSGFPDVLDKWVLTDIKTSNSNCSLYGINIGDSFNKATEILYDINFSEINTNREHIKVFKKRKLIITFTITNEKKIKEIEIKLESTNKENVVF